MEPPRTRPRTRQQHAAMAAWRHSMPEPELPAVLDVALLHETFTHDAGVFCRLLSLSHRLNERLAQRLRGALHVRCTEDMAGYIVDDCEYYDPRAEDDFVPSCEHTAAHVLAPWLARHGQLLCSLALTLRRVEAPLPEGFRWDSAPAGRACCGCCGMCGGCDWDNIHSTPYAGMRICPEEEAAVARALAAAGAGDGLVLQSLELAPASAAILAQAPPASLTALDLTWWDEDETVHAVPAKGLPGIAAALGRLTALRSASFSVWPASTFVPLALDALISPLARLSGLTALQLERVGKPDASLPRLPAGLVQLTLALLARHKVLQLGHLSALRELELSLCAPLPNAEHFDEQHYPKPGPLLREAGTLPQGLTRLVLADAAGAGVESLLQLSELRALVLEPCTLEPASLLRLGSLSALQCLALTYVGPGSQQAAAAAAAAGAWAKLPALRCLALERPLSRHRGWRSGDAWPRSVLTALLPHVAALSSLRSLVIADFSAAPQQLADAIAPLTGLTELVLEPLPDWNRADSSPSHGPAGAGAGAATQQAPALSTEPLAAVIRGLPQLQVFGGIAWSDSVDDSKDATQQEAAQAADDGAGEAATGSPGRAGDAAPAPAGKEGV